jgi:hypothetical protein
MSTDEPEILPPVKRMLPAERGDDRSVPAVDDGLPLPTGVIAYALSGFQAQWQARAYRDIAANIRAQKDVLDAETARRESTITLLRKTGELRDIKDTLALDKAQRAAERAAHYAGLTARYEQIEDDQDERAHQRELTALRRQREIEEANAQIVEAKRGTFNAKQGLENQKHLKQLNMEIWQKRAAAEQMDAEKIWLLLRKENDGIKTPQKKAADGSLEHLVEIRASLEDRAQEAAASGDASKAERYAHLASELDALVLAAMRGDGQK